MRYGRADISNIRSMGSRARAMMSAGNSTLGLRSRIQLRSFSSVFIFMNRHSLQRQFSVGAGMKVLPGHSF